MPFGDVRRSRAEETMAGGADGHETSQHRSFGSRVVDSVDLQPVGRRNGRALPGRSRSAAALVDEREVALRSEITEPPCNSKQLKAVFQ